LIKKIIQLIVIILIWEFLAGCASLPISGLSNIPPDTYIGVVEKSPSLEDCRRQAIVSAGEQIALNVSTEIQVKYQKISKGNRDYIDQTVEDSYKHLSEMILGDVISNTEKISFKKRWGSYSCHIVVRYSRGKIEKLRKEAKSINELRRRIRREEQKRFQDELAKQRKYYSRRDKSLEREIVDLRETVENDSWIDKKALKRNLREKAEDIQVLAQRGWEKVQNAWWRFKEEHIRH